MRSNPRKVGSILAEESNCIRDFAGLASPLSFAAITSLPVAAVR